MRSKWFVGVWVKLGICRFPIRAHAWTGKRRWRGHMEAAVSRRRSHGALKSSTGLRRDDIMSFMDLFEAPLHHGLHTWLTEEMGFVHDVVTDTYRHPERNICVSGTAVRAAAVDCIDADETRTFISDVFFGALPGNA